MLLPTRTSTRWPTRLLVALALASVTLGATAAQAYQGVFVVRHAEKASSTDPDTALSMQGEDRALALARFLRNAKVKRVFVSDKKRTLQTAEPLADQHGLEATRVPAVDTPALLKQLKATGADEVVLVVGHSDTIPGILKGLGVKDAISIRDDQYGRVFFVDSAGRLIELAY